MPETRSPGRRWTRADYAYPAATLARRLIGALLVRRLPDGTRLSGRIVETEAYLGARDQGAHSFGGRRTPRVEPMYGPAGTAYVYFTYGMHFCFNVVAGKEGEPVAVLVRALVPVEGVEAMRTRRRGIRDDAALCRGPACICQALSMDRALSGVDMTTSDALWIESDERTPGPWRLTRTARIGLRSAGDWTDRPLRWLVTGEPSVSRPPPKKRGRETPAQGGMSSQASYSRSRKPSRPPEHKRQEVVVKPSARSAPATISRRVARPIPPGAQRRQRL